MAARDAASTDLLAALADGAGENLLARDRGALVGLGVGPQAHAVRGAERSQLGHIALERVEVDQERGSVDLVDACTDAGGAVVHRGRSFIEAAGAVGLRRRLELAKPARGK